jgi:iron(III) transport system substrate-binding protein
LDGLLIQMTRLRISQSSLSVFLYLLELLLLLFACSPNPRPNQVIIYTSVDQPFSEPILDRFEKETGIHVQAIYDVEAAKTTGLVNRLIAEKRSPQADVFWNSEILQTIRLRQEGVLQPYASPQSAGIPSKFRDPDGYWTGNTARARVIIVNTSLIPDPEAINSMHDFYNPAWGSNQVGIAYPLFGTAATHAAALYNLLGPNEAKAYYQRLVDHGIRVVDGNAAVRDLVVGGSLAFGFTDTDDACGALARGAPVALVFPDQQTIGTLVIPSTVALIAGAPNPEQGRALIDYLLSPNTEKTLLESDYSHIPLHPDIQLKSKCISQQTILSMDVDFEAVYDDFELAQTDMQEIFLR